MSLKENYKNDIYAGERKYRMIQNDDGTVSFQDVTVYTQDGDIFSADDINATNKAVNAIDLDNTEFRAGITTRMDVVEMETASLMDGMIIRLPASGWSSTAPYTQVMSIPGLNEGNRPFYGLLLTGTLSDVTTDAQEVAWGYVDRIASGDGKATAYCYRKKPAVDVTLVVKGVVSNG